MSLYQFMGKDYSKDVAIPTKGPSFLELPQRERKKKCGFLFCISLSTVADLAAQHIP